MNVTKMATSSSSLPVTSLGNALYRIGNYPERMVARIGPNKPVRVFLREWRQHFRLSQDELAARLNTSKATVSRKENQKRGYDVGYIAAVAEVLGREFTEMFSDPARPTQADLL